MQAAVNAMRLLLGQINIDGTVVIGEGEKDHAPMLYNGERIGGAVQANVNAAAVQFVDIAVDPIDGTRLLVARLAERALRHRHRRSRGDVLAGASRLHG